MIHGNAEFNVSKVPRAAHVILCTRHTGRRIGVGGSHPGVIYTIGERISQLIDGHVRSHLDDAPTPRVLIGVETVLHHEQKIQNQQKGKKR